MYQYKVYDLILKSDFRLPELPEVDRPNSNVDVLIEQSDIGPVADSIDNTPGRDIEVTADKCRLTYDSVGTFLVKGGNRIFVNTESHDIPQTKRFRRLLTNEIMCVLLHQRGYLVLHASAVSVDGSGVVFVGQRGAGKSTTAAAFFKDGYPVLADDVVAVQFTDDSINIVPSVPEMRLMSDAVEALGIKNTTRPPGDWGPEKEYQATDYAERTKVKKFYILRPGDELKLRSVTGKEALFTLIESTYTRGLLTDTETTPENFRQCSRISREVPFDILERPQDHGRLLELVRFVAEDLNEA